jgi:hypothetical protein
MTMDLQTQLRQWQGICTRFSQKMCGRSSGRNSVTTQKKIKTPTRRPPTGNENAKRQFVSSKKQIDRTGDSFLNHCQMPSLEMLRQHKQENLCHIRVPHPTHRFEAVKKKFHARSERAKKSNIFGTAAEAGQHGSHATGFNSLAHLVPRDFVGSVFWPYCLDILTGETEGTEEQRFCAVHGFWNSSVSDDSDKVLVDQ